MSEGKEKGALLFNNPKGIDIDIYIKKKKKGRRWEKNKRLQWIGWLTNNE